MVLAMPRTQPPLPLMLTIFATMLAATALRAIPSGFIKRNWRLRRRPGSQTTRMGSVTDTEQRALEKLVPRLSPSNHKGQLGRVGILGGSKDYAGAPYFAGVSALRTGADLVYLFTAAEAAPAIKSYSPELMVTPVYQSGWPDGVTTCTQAMVDAVSAVLPKLHSLVVGPGLGRDPHVLRAAGLVVAAARARGLPIVLDADALVMVCQYPESVRGYPRAVLTPNAYEFQRLCEELGVAAEARALGDADGEEDGQVPLDERVGRLARQLGVTIVLKGHTDYTCDGDETLRCGVEGGLKRCGGIGDVLSGAIGTMLAWTTVQGFQGTEARDMLRYAAHWGCTATKLASRQAYNAKGRSMSATDVVDHMGHVMERLVPSPPAVAGAD